jgi:tetratricopeptide (TPR) repeat protein
MTMDEVAELINDLELSGAWTRGALAEELERRARALPVGTEGRAQFWFAAGEGWQHDGDTERAVTCFEEAIADGGPTTVNATAGLIGARLDAGDDAQADLLLAELRQRVRAGNAPGIVHEYVADMLEAAGRLEDALRWYTAGLTHLDRSEPASGSDFEIFMLASARHRVRRALDLPRDRYDLMVEEVRAAIDPAARPSPTVVPVLCWRREQHALLLDTFPELADVEHHASFDTYREATELLMRDQPEGPLGVVLGDVQAYLVFAQQHRLDPNESGTRRRYASYVASSGAYEPWPPGRNERCWCRSGIKYKKCCGSVRAAVVPETVTIDIF